MEVDCFLVPEGTENKPGLSGWGRETKLKGQDNCRLGCGVGGFMQATGMKL